MFQVIAMVDLAVIGKDYNQCADSCGTKCDGDSGLCVGGGSVCTGDHGCGGMQANIDFYDELKGL